MLTKCGRGLRISIGMSYKAERVPDHPGLACHGVFVLPGYLTGFHLGIGQRLVVIVDRRRWDTRVDQQREPLVRPALGDLHLQL